MEDFFVVLQAAIPSSGSIGEWRIRDVFQRGTKTTLMRAEAKDGRVVAIQLPYKEYANDSELTRRFEREVGILQKLTGDAFPAFLEHGTYEAGGRTKIPYIVTEFPQGRILSDVLQDKKTTGEKPDVQAGIRLITSLARALAQVHDNGIVHRNLTPGRVSVTPDGGVQIFDFFMGLGGTPKDVTRKGSFVGTARYVAPEQLLRPHEVDGRADLYSLGLIVYIYTTFVHPFPPSSTQQEELVKHLSMEPAAPSTVNPEIPPELDKIVSKLLQVNPESRYRDVHALTADLEESFPAVRS